MVKRKEVGVSGSSKKKMGVSNQRSEVKLKKRRGKIKKVVVNKGKRPIMRFDSNSDSSESDVRVVRKKRKKTSKDADYTEGKSETENHTESGNKSEDSVRNAIINDVLEAPTSDYSSESGDDRKTKRLLPTNCFGMMYVEDKMKEFYKAMRVDHPFLDNTFTKTEVAECIQQVETFVDCRVIVCVHIENAIRKRSQREMVFTNINSGTYRKMMTEMFLESESLSTG
ncbi:hypothetical protein OROGR_022319 [Orobanche gracilis]